MKQGERGFCCGSVAHCCWIMLCGSSIVSRAFLKCVPAPLFRWSADNNKAQRVYISGSGISVCTSGIQIDLVPQQDLKQCIVYHALLPA